MNKWLEEDFLGYISDWETYVKNIDGVSQKIRQKMLLSPQTLLGLKITGEMHAYCRHNIILFLHFTIVFSEIICGSDKISIYVRRCENIFKSEDMPGPNRKVFWLPAAERGYS